MTTLKCLTIIYALGHQSRVLTNASICKFSVVYYYSYPQISTRVTPTTSRLEEDVLGGRCLRGWLPKHDTSWRYTVLHFDVPNLRSHFGGR